MLRERMNEEKRMLLNGWMIDASRSDSRGRNGHNCKSGRRKTPRGRFLYAHNHRGVWEAYNYEKRGFRTGERGNMGELGKLGKF